MYGLWIVGGKERRDDCLIFVWDGMHALGGFSEEIYLNVSVRRRKRGSTAVDFVFWLSK